MWCMRVQPSFPGATGTNDLICEYVKHRADSPGELRAWCPLQAAAAADVQALRDGGKMPVILHFWASWAPMCAQTKEIASRLAGECQNVRFANVEAEEAEVRHPLHLPPCFCCRMASPASRCTTCLGPRETPPVAFLTAWRPCIRCCFSYAQSCARCLAHLCAGPSMPFLVPCIVRCCAGLDRNLQRGVGACLCYHSEGLNLFLPLLPPIHCRATMCGKRCDTLPCHAATGRGRGAAGDRGCKCTGNLKEGAGAE